MQSVILNDNTAAVATQKEFLEDVVEVVLIHPAVGVIKGAMQHAIGKVTKVKGLKDKPPPPGTKSSAYQPPGSDRFVFK